MSRERNRRYEWKKDFKFSKKKSKAGEVTVTELRNGFRTLSVSGKIKTSSNILSLHTIQSSLKYIGLIFLGFFPFLKQKKSTFITTYSIPTTYHNTRSVYMYYDYTFTLADNTPSEEAISSVLNKMKWLGDKISNEINESISDMLEVRELIISDKGSEDYCERV